MNKNIYNAMVAAFAFYQNEAIAARSLLDFCTMDEKEEDKLADYMEDCRIAAIKASNFAYEHCNEYCNEDFAWNCDSMFRVYNPV